MNSKYFSSIIWTLLYMRPFFEKYCFEWLINDKAFLLWDRLASVFWLDWLLLLSVAAVSSLLSGLLHFCLCISRIYTYTYMYYEFFLSLLRGLASLSLARGNWMHQQKLYVTLRERDQDLCHSERTKAASFLPSLLINLNWATRLTELVYLLGDWQ